MTAKRNGKIELMRFIFCICVLFYHINKDLWGGDKLIADGISFFSHGRTGVEFFFIVSGFLMAKSAFKYKDKKANIADSTFNFVLNKIKGVWTPHIILVTLMIILLIVNDKLTFVKFFDKLPSVFFLQCTGISDKYFLAVEWYLSSLFFALAVIYPFLLKSFDFTSKVLAPVGSIALIGYMITKYNKLPSSAVPDSFISPNNLRAIAIILLGVFCYTVCEKIKETELNKPQKIVLVIVENLCWAASLFYIVSDLKSKYEGLIVLVVAVAVSLCFSRNLNSKIYNNAFAMYLGRISLTVYLCQNLIRNFVRFYFDMSNKKLYTVLVFALTVLLGIILDFVCEMINKRVLKRRTLK